MMHIKNLAFLPLFVIAAGVVVAACGGDDVTDAPVDAGHYDGTTGPTVDASNPSDANRDGGLARRLLVSHHEQTGEMVAIDTTKKNIDGRLDSIDGFPTIQTNATAPFIMSDNDAVTRLDPATPWITRSLWSVLGNDATDDAGTSADPIQIIETAANKAYILRFNRNGIGVIDPSQTTDAGVATKYVDLSSLVQANDKDGHVDMAGAVYDPTRKRLYVALENIDLHLTDPVGYFLICAATTSSLIAIDTTTDAIVDLGGTAPGGGIALHGKSPTFGTSGGVIYDAAADRILVLSSGCNDPVTDGGMGAMDGRLIEAVSLKSNTSSVLVDLEAQDYPGQLLYVDGHTAFVQIGFPGFATVYRWDPATNALGTALANAPDTFDYDSKTNALVGPRVPTLSDGGSGTPEIVSVALDDAGATTVLVTAPFHQSGGYFGNAVFFPAN